MLDFDAILFDFDGTLSATMARQESWFRYWSAVHEKIWLFANFHQFLETYNECLRNADDVSTGVQNFYDLLGLPCNMKDLTHPVWTEYREYLRKHPSGLIPGIKDLLNYLHQQGALCEYSSRPRRTRLGINTTNSWQSAHRDLLEAGVLHLFDSQIGAEMLEIYHGAGQGSSIHKPSKLSVQLSLAQLGSTGSNTLYIGDTVQDLLAGKDVFNPTTNQKEDLIVIGVSWGFESREILEAGGETFSGRKVSFDYIVDTPEELRLLIVSVNTKLKDKALRRKIA